MLHAAVFMNPHEYRLVAMGATILVIVLTLFWYGMLKRFGEVLNERMGGKGRKLDSVASVVQFLVRAEYMRLGDEQLIAVCKRLRTRLYSYLGGIGAYLVFIIIMRPRF